MTLLRFFAHISATSKNFKIKFYMLKDNSYLRIIAKFHQKIPQKTKVILLLVSQPTVF